MTSEISTESKGTIEKINGHGPLEYGQYFRYNLDDHDVFGSGAIYPIISMSMHHISKDVHDVTLFIPRSETSDEMRMRIGIIELERDFTHVPSESAKLERSIKMADLQAKGVAIQQEMQQVLADPQSMLGKLMSSNEASVIAERNLLDFDVPILPSPEMMDSNSREMIPLTDGKSVDVIRRQMANQQKLGGIVKVYAEAKLKAVNLNAACVQSLINESSYALLSQANEMAQDISSISEKMEQLDLYLGDDVEITIINDAPESTCCGPVHFFSQKLFCNEEMAIDDLFSDDGFTYEDAEYFFEKLRTEPSFRDRVLPLERSVVCVQLRRSPFKYVDCPIENRERNVHNFKAGILVRDGERICLINSPLEFGQRLFPTQKEMDDVFGGVRDVEDVKLADAQKALEAKHQTYSKVASVLQGAIDRQDTGGCVVFGQLPMNGVGKSLFTPTYVRSNVRFINDEDYLLGELTHIPNPNEWLENLIRSDYCEGDEIILNASDYLTPVRSSGAFVKLKIHEKPEQRYYGDDAVSVFKVMIHKGRRSIKCPVTDYKGNSKSVWINVEKLRAVVAHKLRPSELEVLLESRVHRPVMMQHMTLLLPTRGYAKSLMNVGRDIINWQLAEREHNGYWTDVAYHSLIQWLASSSKNAKLLSDSPAKALLDFQKYSRSHPALSKEALATTETQLLERGLTPVCLIERSGKRFAIADGRKRVNSAAVSFTKQYASETTESGTFQSFEPLTGKGTAPLLLLRYAVDDKGNIGDEKLVTSELIKYPLSHVFSRKISDLNLDELRQAHTERFSQWRVAARTSSDHGSNLESLNSEYEQLFDPVATKSAIRADYRKYIASLQYVDYSDNVMRWDLVARLGNRRDELLALAKKVSQASDDSEKEDTIEAIWSYIDENEYIREAIDNEELITFPSLFVPTNLHVSYETFGGYWDWKLNGIEFNFVAAIHKLFHSMSKTGQRRARKQVRTALDDITYARAEVVKGLLDDPTYHNPVIAFRSSSMDGYIGDSFDKKVKSYTSLGINFYRYDNEKGRLSKAEPSGIESKINDAGLHDATWIGSLTTIGDAR